MMTNPYKKGSAKAEIYTVFTDTGGGEKGLAAAHKRAKKLDIKEGTVKSWASMWLKGLTKPATKEGDDGKKPTLKAISTKDREYHPLFRHDTRAKADKEHESLCTRCGLRPHAFHVIENDGKFAVAPAHYKPGGPAPQFKNGDIVYDALIINSKAKVIEAGPEQCVVRYMSQNKLKGPIEDCVINRYLVKLPDEVEKPSNKKLQKAAEASGALTMKPAKKKERARL